MLIFDNIPLVWSWIYKNLWFLLADFLIYAQILGGNVGFDKKVWEVIEYKKGETPSITFKYESHDGEEGSVFFLSVSLFF